MYSGDVNLAKLIGANIEKIRKNLPVTRNQTQCAEQIGVKQQMWSKWESGQNVPSMEYQLKIAALFTITLDQLWGRAPLPASLGGPSAAQLPQPATPEPALPDLPTIPVIGLTSGNVAGWYNPRPLAVRAPVPTEYEASNKNLFAVLAVGISMMPDGIREGFLLYCDSSITPERFDAVYVKTTDGTATVKRFLGRDNNWIIMQGWLDPDAEGIQKPFVNKFALDYIESIACVVMVKRKA